jgi:hypothetical protein
LPWWAQAPPARGAPDSWWQRRRCAGPSGGLPGQAFPSVR